jgi:hypothetical protein
MDNGFCPYVFRAAFPAIALAMSFSLNAQAQDWMEYENLEDHFAVNFPGEPVVENTTYRLGSGREVSARVYSVENEETANATAHAADNFRRRGEVTSDEVGSYEGMDTQMMQLTNPDASRSFIAIVHPPANSGIIHLYIAEGRAPANGVVPGLFQQSLSLRDQDGIRVRYNRDLDGNRFRVIPGSGGEPLRRRPE